MRITIIVNNHAKDKYILPENGLSILIEDENINILFDTGSGKSILKNISHLGINILNITHVVASHGHLDHAGGLTAIGSVYQEKTDNKLPLIAHPNIFINRGIYLKIFWKIFLLKNMGVSKQEKEIRNLFKCNLKSKPFYINENIIFLGEIPIKKGLESGMASGSINNFETLQPDSVIDDSALAIKTENGLVIITGCAHSGIMNIIEYARNVSNESRIYAIIGGLHLKRENHENIKTISNYFEESSINYIYCCHCTGRAIKYIKNAIEVKAGYIFDL